MKYDGVKRVCGLCGSDRTLMGEGIQDVADRRGESLGLFGDCCYGAMMRAVGMTPSVYGALCAYEVRDMAFKAAWSIRVKETLGGTYTVIGPYGDGAFGLAREDDGDCVEVADSMTEEEARVIAHVLNERVASFTAVPEQAEPVRGMTKAQRVAIGEYLDNYPDDASYEDVLKLFAAGCPDTLVRAPFEHEAPADIVEYIEALRVTLEATYGKD